MSWSSSTDTLASSILVASVTYLAIYLTLYPFVFNYFREKSESEREQRGLSYWNFFGRVMALSILLVFGTAFSAVALAYQSEVALAVSFGAFLVSLIIGTYGVLIEISTTRKLIMPYARADLWHQTYDGAFGWALGESLKSIGMGGTVGVEVFTNAREVAIKIADEAVRQSPFADAEKSELERNRGGDRDAARDKRGEKL